MYKALIKRAILKLEMPSWVTAFHDEAKQTKDEQYSYVEDA